MQPSKATPNPPRRYSDEALRVISLFSDGWGTCDALNVELIPGGEIHPTIPVWGVGIDRAGIVIAGIVELDFSLRFYRFKIHQGDRLTAAHWLRTELVPVVRISTKQPKGNSPIRWNNHFQETIREQHQQQPTRPDQQQRGPNPGNTDPAT